MLINLRNALMAGGSEPAPDYWGLCFTAEENGSTVAMAKQRACPSVSLETSTDGTIWTPFVIGTTIITLANVGDRVYFRAGDGGTGGDGVNVKFASNGLAYNYFVMTGKVAASGDISSILDRSSSVLSFVAQGSTTSRTWVFSSLFRNCTSLTTAPHLPATTLAANCYYAMFQGCTSLIQPPTLPASTLANTCYYYMFYGCTGLVSAPALPATTLTQQCYRAMFNSCTSLTTAPSLPATTLVSGCYDNMFNGCSSLQSVEINFTAWSSTNNWLSGVAASGTFKCPAALGTNDTITRGVSNCPEGWTVVNV